MSRFYLSEDGNFLSSSILGSRTSNALHVGRVLGCSSSLKIKGQGLAPLPNSVICTFLPITNTLHHLGMRIKQGAIKEGAGMSRKTTTLDGSLLLSVLKNFLSNNQNKIILALIN